MAIVSSTYTLDGHAQVDGRTYVVETHTDGQGQTYKREYLSHADTNHAAVAASYAIQLEAALAETEFQELVNG